MKQNVIFILNGTPPLKTDSDCLWKYVRNAIHSIRSYSYEKKLNLSICFANLSSDQKYDLEKNLSFEDFDTFSIENEKKDEYFSKMGFSALNYFFSTSQTRHGEKQPLIIILDAEGLEDNENYSRLNSLVNFGKAKKIIVPKKIWQDGSLKLGASGRNFSFLRNFISSASQSRFAKPLLACAGAVLLLAVLLMIFVPRIASFIQNHKIPHVATVYKKVYTGDGDRLILRREGDLSAEELLRLNEGEVVMVEEEGEEWDKIYYHGFEGYVHNEYLASADEEEYVITNPDTMYTYGKSCLVNGLQNEYDGYYWIEKSASLGEVTAQWEMYRFYENGSLPVIISDSEKALSYLYEIDRNEKSYEELEAEECRAKAKSLETTSQKDLVQKFLAKAAEKERNAKAIKRQAAKKMSELKFYSEPELASDFYKKALSLGLEGDPDYMYSLAVDTELNDEDSLSWLKKASGMGHYNSSRLLANYYFNRDNYEPALTYFKAAAEQSSGASAPYYCAYIYYHYYQNYYQAVKYFKDAYNAYDYSQEFYNASYYLGWCYEYGQGCSVNYSFALNYYNMARGHVNGADDAYSRVYDKVYDDYWW